MADQRTDAAEAAQVALATDSHGAANKPSRKVAPLREAADQAQNALDVRSAVPLHLKLVLSYAEVAALGISPERTLRRLVAVGRVKRSLLRVGRRVGFIVRDLLDELRQVEE